MTAASTTTPTAQRTSLHEARKQRHPGRTVGRVIGWVVLAAALVWSLFPIYWMLVTSFKNDLEVVRLDPTYWPHAPTFGNYGKLVGHALPFTSFLANSLLTSFVTALLTIVLSAFAGYSLSRGNYRLRGTMSYVILVVRMLPLVVLIGPLYLLLLGGHLLDSWVGLVVAFTSFAVPFGAWMMKSFFDGVPREVEEAARVDGYHRTQILFRVVLPLVYPGLLTTGAFVFMEAWNNLLYPLTFMTTLTHQTLPAGLLTSFTGQFKTDWGGMMAASCITTLPLLVVFLAVQRSMVRGLTSGAVAGE